MKKLINPRNKVIVTDTDYEKEFVPNENALLGLKRALRLGGNEVYILNQQKYEDGSGSVTITMHFKY